MFRKTAKQIVSSITILYFVFLTLFGLSDYLYPDTISRFAGDLPEDQLCFSLTGYDKTALTQQEKNSVECQVVAFGFLPIKSIQVDFHPKMQVVCGGELFGVRMHTNGLLVTETGLVETEKGPQSPGESAGIQKGDILLTADGVNLQNAADLAKIVSRCQGGKIRLEIERDGEKKQILLQPALATGGAGYKAGLWVRDGAAGIGTVTFIDPASGCFAGLGHAVCDSGSGTAFPLKAGSVCHAKIEGIKKGENGVPGEIKGRLEKEDVGSVLANTPTGIYGTIPQSSYEVENTVPIGLKSEVKPGKASIFCTLDNTQKKEYEIEIEQIIGKDQKAKNFIVHVTDPALLSITGGIIQGMSGSPIVQDGKLVGAVTHVLVGDSTRGYGIFIENMLETAQSVAEQQLKEAS